MTSSALSATEVEPAPVPTPPILSLRGLVVQFPGVRALDGVDLDVRAGEVVGLVGENGAGKSTLVSVLAGLRPGYEGQVSVDGSPVDLTNPIRSGRAGIALVQQELSLVPELSVAENIMLGRLPRGAVPGFVDRRATFRAAEGALGLLELDVELRRLVRQLSPAQAQIVEIAKGLAREPRVLILDEPTSSLSSPEALKLLDVVRRLSSAGIAVLYISHKLDEVLAVADRITVLRDGRKVAEGPVAEWDEQRVVRSMVGRDLSQFFQRHPHDPGEVVLEVRDLTSGTAFEGVSLQVRESEVLGIAGLVGAGRTEVAEAVFGLRRVTGGAILVGGKTVAIRSPRDAVDHGVALVSEDRRGTGIVGEQSTMRNVSLASLRRLSWGPFVQRRRERSQVGQVAARVQLTEAALRRSIRTLSGGNQQKAVIGKWLLRTPRVLILDEPTRGIDVGAKSEIYKLIDELTADGMAVILVSSEMPEVLGLSDRVAVMRKGRLVHTFERGEVTEEAVMAFASDGGRPAPTSTATDHKELR